MNTNNNQLNIENLAELAKISLSTEELKKFRGQIKDVINHFSSLKNINTEDFISNYWEIDEKKVVGLDGLRKDEVKGSFKSNEVFQNAPEKENGFFKIRKIFDR